MRGLTRFAALLLALPLAASAGVVQRLSPSLGATASPAPVLSLSMSGPVAANFSPALTGVLSAPSLVAPAPALLPSFSAPSASLKPVSIPAQALASRPLSAPASLHDRGPPSARAKGFSTFVANSVADTVRSWRVPSREILEDHDALLVGENHESLASVTELSRALPELARAGVSVLGIEGLKRPNQEAVDAYISGRTDIIPGEVLAFSPRRRAAFETLLKTARETGVRVVALGLPLDLWSRQVAELAAAKTGDPLESFLRSPGEQLYRAQTGYESGYNEAVAEVYLTRRNQSMAMFLAEAMLRGAKAVALVGQNHVEGVDAITLKFTGKPDRWGTLGRELARLGMKAFSLTLTGGRYIDADGARNDRDARRASYSLAAKLSPQGAPAFKRTGANTGLYHAGGTVPGMTVAH